MKRNLYIGLAAFVALTLSACQREARIDHSANMVTVTLTADKAGETRAAANEGTDKVTYTWTDTDVANLKLMSVTIVGEGDDAQENFEEVEKTTTLSSDNRTLSITATVEAGTVLRAAVASEWTGKEGDKTRKPRQPMIQHPSADNFDPAADILVSEDVTATGALAEEKLVFNRPVTVDKLTLKSMVAGEKVSKVTITSDKNLVGYYQYDKSQMTAQHKDVTLQYDTPLAVPASGEFPVYFTAMPGQDHTFTIVVETSKDSKNYRYVVEGIGTVTFTQGKFARFSVDLDGYRKEIVNKDYSGEWVIGGSNGTKALAATAYATGNFYPVSDVTIEGEVVEVPSSPEDYKMTIARVTSGEYAGLYTIVDAGGKYLTANTAANNSMIGVDTPTANSYWTIAEAADGSYEILAANLADNQAKMMCVNFSSPRVSCYVLSTTQKKVTLYPYAKIKVAEPPTTVFQFQKVAAVTSGKQYLIVADDGSKLRAAKLITGNYGYPGGDEVTDVDGVITVASMDNAFTFTSETGGYTIKQSDNRYWYLKGTYTSFNVDAAPTEGQYFTFAKNTDGTFTITNVAKSSFVQYSVGHSSYGCYTTAQTDGKLPFLYEYIGEGGTTPTTYAVNIASGITNGTVTASKTTGIAEGESVTLTVAPATNYELESLTVDGANVTSSVSANKYTFSMPAHDVAVGATFKAASATLDFTTVAELNGKVTTTSTEYKGHLTDAVVSFVPTKGTAIIKDATGSIMYYKSSHGLKQGQTFSGDITVKAIKYNGLYSEITDLGTATFSGDEAAVEPESVTIANLIGQFDKYQNAYVKVTELSVVNKDGKNITVTDGTNNYIVFDNTNTVDCSAGDIVASAKGTVTKYNTTEEIKIWNKDDITIRASGPKAVTFTQPTQAGCSIAVTVGGSAITSGSTVAAGTTVTLTATVGADYAFGGWNVTGATVASTTAATTTFTMPSNDVTVSATFNSTTATVVSLTNDEIVDAVSATGVTTDTYGDFSIASASGTWSVNANQKKSLTYLQTRNKSASKIVSPTFASSVSKVVITLDAKQTTNRKVHVIPSNTAVPTENTNYQASLWENQYGQGQTGSTGGSMTIELTGAPTSFIIVVEGGTLFTDSIDVHLN